MSREKKTPVPERSDSADHIMALDALLTSATPIDINEEPDQLLAALVTADGELLDLDRLTISLPSYRVTDRRWIAYGWRPWGDAACCRD